MKIVLFGTPSFVIPILKVLMDNFQVFGVVTAPDTVVGRKKILTPSPAKQFALDHNIPVFTLEQLTNDQRPMTKDQIDLFIVAAYGKIIPKEILYIPRLGAINIHPSLLPKYRGTSPVQTTILNGDKETGVTFIKMDEQMDHGPIITQEIVPLRGNETAESLHHQLFQLATELLPTTIQQFNIGIIKPQPQDDTRAVYCKKITKQDGYFDINNPPSPEKLDRMIRAYYPWPTAWTKLKTKNSELKTLKFLPGNNLQFEGGKPMNYKDFVNGYPELKDKIESLNVL